MSKWYWLIIKWQKMRHNLHMSFIIDFSQPSRRKERFLKLMLHLHQLFIRFVGVNKL